LSKESTAGYPCQCGQRIFYQEYHWPHCTSNPANANFNPQPEPVVVKTDVAVRSVKIEDEPKRAKKKRK
jgi:hypothetical protein